MRRFGWRNGSVTVEEYTKSYQGMIDRGETSKGSIGYVRQSLYPVSNIDWS